MASPAAAWVADVVKGPSLAWEFPHAQGQWKKKKVMGKPLTRLV